MHIVLFVHHTKPKSQSWSAVMSTFMNTPEERHAFIIGLSTTVAWFNELHSSYLTFQDYLVTEHHYYCLGRFVGVLVDYAMLMGLILVVGGF